MNDIFVFAAHNTVVALAFALFVYGLTRVWRNPPVAHLLWLLVLFKLVAPPVMRVDWSALGVPGSTHCRGQIIADVSPVEGQKAEGHLRFADRPTARTTAQVSATNVKEPVFAAGIRRFWSRGRPVLLWFWLGGAALCALVAAARIVRFERLLRDTLPASGRLQRLAIEIAGRLGVRRVPDVRFVECVELAEIFRSLVIGHDRQQLRRIAQVGKAQAEQIGQLGIERAQGVDPLLDLGGAAAELVDLILHVIDSLVAGLLNRQQGFVGCIPRLCDQLSKTDLIGSQLIRNGPGLFEQRIEELLGFRVLALYAGDPSQSREGPRYVLAVVLSSAQLEGPLSALFSQFKVHFVLHGDQTQRGQRGRHTHLVAHLFIDREAFLKERFSLWVALADIAQHGVDVASREFLPGARFIFISGDPDIEDVWQIVRKEGADGFIHKPFDINEIDVAVSHLLGSAVEA